MPYNIALQRSLTLTPFILSQKYKFFVAPHHIFIAYLYK